MGQSQKVNYPLPILPWILDDDKSGSTLVGFQHESGKITPLVTGAMTDSITANAGGGQTNAVQLLSGMNRVSTVATAGDSVKLPPANIAGLVCTVLNAGANPMQVYGSGSDTINGVASGTGVSQMQSSVVEYFCPAPGVWLAQGIASGYSGSFGTMSSVNSLTAHAGGGQSGTPLNAMINRVTTVATIGDSVLLPASAAGMEITVVNAASNSMNVFPATGEAINALGANTAFAVAGGKTATFYCTNAGQWHSILSA